jgi:hypothetical protein
MSTHRPEKVRAWRALVEAWKRSGQTVSAFCRARQITRSNFDRWRRILVADSVVSSPSPAFVPVRVVAEPMAEVVLRSGVVVRVPLGTEADAVTRLVTRARGVTVSSTPHPHRPVP